MPWLRRSASRSWSLRALVWRGPWRSGPTPTATAPLPLPSKPSIAVLPFDNMSGDAEQAYFADGVTEDLITDLSKVGGLFVIARNSTFVYKGKARDVREVAQDARRTLRAGGQRPAQRWRDPRQRPAHRRHDGRPCVGRSLRRRDEEYLRTAGQGQQERRGRPRGGADQGRSGARRPARDGERASLRRVPQGLAALPPADAGRFPRGDRGLQEGRGARSPVRTCVRCSRRHLLGGLPALLGCGPGAAVQARGPVRGRTVPGEGDGRPDAARSPGGQRHAARVTRSTTRPSRKRGARSRRIPTMPTATSRSRTR